VTISLASNRLRAHATRADRGTAELSRCTNKPCLATLTTLQLRRLAHRPSWPSGLVLGAPGLHHRRRQSRQSWEQMRRLPNLILDAPFSEGWKSCLWLPRPSEPLCRGHQRRPDHPCEAHRLYLPAASQASHLPAQALATCSPAKRPAPKIGDDNKLFVHRQNWCKLLSLFSAILSHTKSKVTKSRERA